MKVLNIVLTIIILHLGYLQAGITDKKFEMTTVNIDFKSERIKNAITSEKYIRKKLFNFEDLKLKLLNSPDSDKNIVENHILTAKLFLKTIFPYDFIFQNNDFEKFMDSERKKINILKRLIIFLAFFHYRPLYSSGEELPIPISALLGNGGKIVIHYNDNVNEIYNFLINGQYKNKEFTIGVMEKGIPATYRSKLPTETSDESTKSTIDNFIQAYLDKSKAVPEYLYANFAFGGVGSTETSQSDRVVLFEGSRFEPNKQKGGTSVLSYNRIGDINHGSLYIHHPSPDNTNSDHFLLTLLPSVYPFADESGKCHYLQNFFQRRESERTISTTPRLDIVYKKFNEKVGDGYFLVDIQDFDEFYGFYTSLFPEKPPNGFNRDYSIFARILAARTKAEIEAAVKEIRGVKF